MMVLDLVAALLMFSGALLCFAAAVALIRFPDVLTKLHAITKPQVLGMTLMCLSIAIGLRTWWAAALAILAIGFQLLTAPVSANMLARAAYRSGIIPSRNLDADALADDLSQAKESGKLPRNPTLK